MSFNQNNGAQSHDGSLPRPGSAWSGSYPAATPQGGTAGAAYDAAAAGDGASSPYGGPPPAGDGTALPKKRRWYRSRKVWAIIVAVVVVFVIARNGSNDDSNDAAIGLEISSTASAAASTDDMSEGEETAGAAASDEEAEGAEDAEAPAEEVEEPAAPDTLHFEGTGSDVVSLEGLDSSTLWIVQFNYSGYDAFSAHTLDDAGEYDSLLALELGNYSGMRLLSSSDVPAAIQIDTSGSWTVDVAPYNQAPTWDGNGAYEGSGDTVLVIPDSTSSMATVHLTHNGESSFMITAYKKNRSYPLSFMAIEVGAYDGRTVMPRGTHVLDIMADGDWSITVE